MPLREPNTQALRCAQLLQLCVPWFDQSVFHIHKDDLNKRNQNALFPE